MAFGFDPSIILAHKQYMGPDANETFRTLADLKLRGIQQQQAQASLASMLEQQNQQRTLAGILSKNFNTPDAVGPALAQAGLGQQAAEWLAQQSEIGKRKAETQKTQEQTAREFRESLTGPFMSAKDQASYDAAKSAVSQLMGERGQQFISQLPESYGEAAPHIAAYKTMSLSPDKLAQFEATATEAAKERTFKAEQSDLDRKNRTTNAGIIAGNKATEGAADDTRDLRKEISGRKEIAKYRQASAELTSLKELAKDSSGASDMALVFAFMKAMDPESVVREAEYSAAAATGTPDQRMMGLVSKYWTGGPLSPGQRQAFIKAATAAQSGHKRAYDSAVKTYRHVAKKRGFDLSELGIEDESAPKTGPHGASVNQGGHTYTWNPDSGAYE